MQAAAVVGGRQALDLVPDAVDALEAEVGAEEAGELDGDDPVRPGLPGRHDLLGEALTRPFDVGRRSRPLDRGGSGQDDVGEQAGRARDGVDGDEEGDRLERLRGEAAVREVGERVGAEQHERPDLGAAARLQHAGRVHAPLVRAASPRRRRTSPPPRRADTRPGRMPGARPMSRAPMDVGAAQGGKEARARPGLGEHGCGRRQLRRPTRRARPTEHDDDAAPSGEDSSAPPRAARARSRRPSRHRVRRREVRPTRPRASDTLSPGGSGARRPRHPRARSARASSSTICRPSLAAAARSRRCRTGRSSRRSPASTTTALALQASSIVARGSEQTSSAGRPSPSWASRLSVPMTLRASLDQA